MSDLLFYMLQYSSTSKLNTRVQLASRVPFRNIQDDRRSIKASGSIAKQHFLNFFPLPHRQGSLRPTLRRRLRSGASHCRPTRSGRARAQHSGAVVLAVAQRVKHRQPRWHPRDRIAVDEAGRTGRRWALTMRGRRVANVSGQERPFMAHHGCILRLKA
jgi:hypothetical protein